MSRLLIFFLSLFILKFIIWNMSLPNGFTFVQIQIGLTPKGQQNCICLVYFNMKLFELIEIVSTDNMDIFKMFCFVLYNV